VHKNSLFYLKEKERFFTMKQFNESFYEILTHFFSYEDVRKEQNIYICHIKKNQPGLFCSVKN